jgi:hypothetical protein
MILDHSIKTMQETASLHLMPNVFAETKAARDMPSENLNAI